MRQRRVDSKFRSRLNQAGFTLVEVLVVLTMVALISSVLFQALERSYRLQDRFGEELFSVQQGQMATDWYRQTVQGLHPDYPDGADVFQGAVQEFSGLSTNPLSDDYGVPTRVIWKLRRSALSGLTELVYVDKKQETPILSWRSRDAKFVYLDDGHIAHDRWPPPLGLFPQLPRQIQLRIEGAPDSLTLAASPMGPARRPMRTKDVLGITP